MFAIVCSDTKLNRTSVVIVSSALLLGRDYIQRVLAFTLRLYHSNNIYCCRGQDKGTAGLEVVTHNLAVLLVALAAPDAHHLVDEDAIAERHMTRAPWA